MRLLLFFVFPLALLCQTPAVMRNQQAAGGDLGGFWPNPTVLHFSGSTILVGNLNGIRFASRFPGGDCGAQINNAYADLPSTGGEIYMDTSCTYFTPIVFGTNHKPATLIGYPAGAVTLTFGGTTGTAITLNYGTDLVMGKGLRDITLTGPSHSTASRGILMGGSNGAQGTLISNITVQAFGTDFEMSNNTWIADIVHSMFRDAPTLVLLPGGLVQAGENINFNNDTFADSLSTGTPTSSVWVQGGGQEVNFDHCSFDQAQLRIGNGGSSSAQVNVIGSHFENPDFATGLDYAYVQVDNNNGNYLRMTDCYFLQDRTTGGAYSTFMRLLGGVVQIVGAGMFTPAGAPLTTFATLGNAVNVNLFGFNDLSGSVSNLLGGSTTGYVMSFPGTNTASTTGFNNIIGAGDAVGGALLDVNGTIRAKNHQLVSTIGTGTAPFIVNSSTPVNNLFANAIFFAADGTQIVSRTHFVQGASVTLSGGSATVNLVGSAAFANASSYSCAASDTTSAAAVQVTYSSGSQFVLNGASGDNASYLCGGS